MRIKKTHLTVIACAVAVALAASACGVSFDPSDPEDPFARPVKPADVQTVSEQEQGQSGAASPDQASSSQASPDLPTGSGTVHAVVLGAHLPESLLSDFQQATGFTLTQTVVGVDRAGIGAGDQDSQAADGSGESGTTVSSENLTKELAEADVVVGADQLDLNNLGAAVDSPQLIGRDDVCVMADEQWFLAGKQPVPTSLEEIAAAATDLVIPASDTPAGRLFELSIQQSEDPTWIDTALANGATRATDDGYDGWSEFSGFVAVAPQSGASIISGNERPLIVSTQSLAVHVLTNTGADSAATPIATTCLKRELFVAAAGETQASDGVEALIAYLISSRGQRALSDAGFLYPNNPAGIDNAMTQFAAPVESAADVAIE